jgi:hypothetical protein
MARDDKRPSGESSRLSPEEERAEKILANARGWDPEHGVIISESCLVSEIAAEIASAVAEAVADKEFAIREAVEEAEKALDKRWADKCSKWTNDCLLACEDRVKAEALAERQAAVQAAYEEAAKIADIRDGHIAKRIRARKDEIGK